MLPESLWIKPEVTESRADGGIYVKGICGDYNNVVGLPVARLFHEMKKLGISLVD